jgi:hypothetical protein
LGRQEKEKGKIDQQAGKNCKTGNNKGRGTGGIILRTTKNNRRTKKQQPVPRGLIKTRI